MYGLKPAKVRTFEACMLEIQKLQFREANTGAAKIGYCICEDNQVEGEFFISLTVVAERFYPERIMCANIDFNGVHCLSLGLMMAAQNKPEKGRTAIWQEA